MEYKQEVASRALKLNSFTDLEPLIEKVKDKKIVMLGESSHGTLEYYEWRRKISLELIKNHGFDFIAVEGDWPPCQKVNEYIQGSGTRNVSEVISSFDRWPTWMWANTEVAYLIDELRHVNEGRRTAAGFHGLDVYSLLDSIDEVKRALSKIDPALAHKAAELYSCFDPFRHDEKEYARSLFSYPEGCRDEVLNILNSALSVKVNDARKKGFLFDAVQNAKVVKNAENYYRAMISASDDSWNVRDGHMMETLEMLLDHYGPHAKGIVWEHNTHIGDYRATDMLLHGQVNLGGLARKKYGEENVALVGFGTYEGTVIASHAWDGPIETMDVPPAKDDTVEAIMHELIDEVGSSDYFLLFDKDSRKSALSEFKGHRAIGVVYHPQFESYGNYVPTALSKRYDAFIFLDETHALTPLRVGFDPRKLPESYPYGSRI